MQYIKTTILAAAALMSGIFLTGCDIEPSDRFEELPPVKIERTALLMDFTGQRCVNCPAAHEIMEELSEQYGDALITVSIHGGGLAISSDRTSFDDNYIGLMIKEGDEMNDAFGIDQWPMGVVDRINAGGAAINTGLWAGAVRDALATPSDVMIEAEADIQGDNIALSATSVSNAEGNKNVALQIWVVEDNIVARQETMDGREPEYVHNNVLRYVQYPVKTGEPLTLAKGVSQTIDVSIPLKWTDTERWNRDNLSIVAFISEGTKILNATRVKVTNDTEKK